MGVPNIFANASATIPLVQLDQNFAANVTIGTTSVGLGNASANLSFGSGHGVVFSNGAFLTGDSTTWTPSDVSGSGISLSAVSCAYTKMGNMVFCYGTLTYGANGSALNAQIGGLPYTVANAGYTGGFFIASIGGSAPQLIGLPVANGTSFLIYGQSTNLAVHNSVLSGQQINFSFMYSTT